MKKSTLIAGLVGSVVYYLLNFLFYGALSVLEGYHSAGAEAVMRGDDSMLHIHLALGHLVTGFAVAHIYSKWARGTHSFFHGAQFGAMLGVAFGLGLNLVWYATSDMMNFTGHLIDSVYQIVALGITVGVISILTGKFEGDA